MFSSEYCEIFKNTLTHSKPPVAASATKTWIYQNQSKYSPYLSFLDLNGGYSRFNGLKNARMDITHRPITLTEKALIRFYSIYVLMSITQIFWKQHLPV